MSAEPLAGTAEHPHARMVLEAAVAGSPSHAYLFHGPPGTGKSVAARAFAAELLAEGADDPDGTRRRVESGAHPDLTWVKPTGAHVMRVEDVADPVVVAAGKTPFESNRRVFVLERVEEMNDEVANRMLKTLEEPPPYAHIVLLTDAPGRVLETVRSRCQLVRFDPLPAERIEAVLAEEGVAAARARACARLALGNLTRARFLSSPEGGALREAAGGLVHAALSDELRSPGAPEPWRPVFDRAAESGERAAAEAETSASDRLELEPSGRDRNALERELEEAAKRGARRAMTEVLDLGLELAALAFRDLVCVSEGVPEAVLASDQAEELAALARGREPRHLREAIEQCEKTRDSLELNVNEELALTALSLRLSRLVGAA